MQDEVKLDNELKKKNLNKILEQATFHRLRDRFPEKVSISTRKLIEAKQKEDINRGPGSYSLTHDQTPKYEKAHQMTSIVSAFGTSAERPLDTREPGVI